MLFGSLFSGSGGGATGGTRQLYGANHSVLGVDELKAFEVEVAHLERLAKLDIVDVDGDALGHVGIDGAHFELLHRESELTTGLHTSGVTFEAHGHFDNHGLLVVHLEEVDVKHLIGNGVELELLEHGVLLHAIDIKLDSEDIGGVDKLAHVLGLHGEVGSDDTALSVGEGDNLLAFGEFLLGSLSVGYDFATVENHGDKVGVAELLSGTLAKLGARGSAQFECLHFLKFCVTQN